MSTLIVVYGIHGAAPISYFIDNQRHFKALIVCLLLSFTVVIATGRESYRLLDHDEFLSLYTDSQPTALGVVRVQLKNPISLDPPTYHLLSHAAMQIFGVGALALRLPAVSGFLLMQVSILLLLCRFASWRVATLGALVAIVTATFSISLEGRPYGMLAGIGAVSILLWQQVTRDAAKHFIASTLLGVALALGVTAHFFGFLLMVPVLTAEGFRYVHARRLDWRILWSLAIALVGFILVLPFRKPAQVYQVHYWVADGKLGLWSIFQCYGAFFTNSHSTAVMGIFGAGLICLTIAASVAVSKSLGDQPGTLTRAEFVALLSLALVPAFGFLIGSLVTHTFQARYVIEGFVGITVLLALGAKPWLERRNIFMLCVSMLVLFTILVTGSRFRHDRQIKAQIESSSTASEAVAKALDEDDTASIYTQDSGAFFRNSYYLQNSPREHRLRMLYGEDEELNLRHRDTETITFRYLERFSQLRFAPFSAFCDGQEHLLLLTKGDPWEWIGEELNIQGATVLPVGEFMGEDLAHVRCGVLQPKSVPDAK